MIGFWFDFCPRCKTKLSLRTGGRARTITRDDKSRSENMQFTRSFEIQKSCRQTEGEGILNHVSSSCGCWRSCWNLRSSDLWNFPAWSWWKSTHCIRQVIMMCFALTPLNIIKELENSTHPYWWKLWICGPARLIDIWPESSKPQS